MLRKRKRLKEPLRLSALIDRHASRWRQKQLAQIEVIRQKWKEAAGDFVAANVVPVRLVRKTLRVATEDAGWLNEMAYLSESILGRLQALLPGAWVDRLEPVVVESLRQMEERFELVPTERPPARRLPVSRAMEEKAQSTAAPIADPDLAACFRRAMLAALRRLDGEQKDPVDTEPGTPKNGET